VVGGARPKTAPPLTSTAFAGRSSCLRSRFLGRRLGLFLLAHLLDRHHGREESGGVQEGAEEARSGHPPYEMKLPVVRRLDDESRDEEEEDGGGDQARDERRESVVHLLWGRHRIFSYPLSLPGPS